MGTHLCEKHTLAVVDVSRLLSSVRQVVENTLAPSSDFDICTPADAAKFLADLERGYTNGTPEELSFYASFETVGIFTLQIRSVQDRFSFKLRLLIRVETSSFQAT